MPSFHTFHLSAQALLYPPTLSLLLISRRAKRKMAEIEEEMRTLQEEQARAPNEDEQKQMSLCKRR